jgi:O-antigen biosynthesis protein
MASRAAFLPRAIDSFLAQDYENRELLILACVADFEALDALIPLDARIRAIPRLPHWFPTLGEVRNHACREAAGGIICHFDDDDWSAAGRLSDQVERLQLSGKAVTGYHSLVFRELRDVRLLEAGVLRATSGWWQWRSAERAAAGTSLCFRRDWWENHPFPAVESGEDDQFWEAAVLRDAAISVEGRDLMYATNHHGNISGRMTGGIEWEEIPASPFRQ